jgi:glutathione peroxidase
VLLVNVASECGYTPQYAQLQELYGQVTRTSGLVVLGFPSNDFGGQEPGDAKARSRNS